MYVHFYSTIYKLHRHNKMQSKVEIISCSLLPAQNQVIFTASESTFIIVRVYIVFMLCGLPHGFLDNDISCNLSNLSYPNLTSSNYLTDQFDLMQRLDYGKSCSSIQPICSSIASHFGSMSLLLKRMVG